MIRKLFYIPILLLWMPFIGSRSYSQSAEATARMDTTAIVIGDQVMLTLELTVPKGSRVNWPFFQDTLTSSVEVLRQRPPDTVSRVESQVIIQQKLVVTSFDSGTFVIPPIPFTYTMPRDTALRSVSTRPLSLEVQTVQTDPKEDIKPIKPPLRAPLTFAEIWPWLLLVLAAGLLGYAIYYIIRKKKLKEPVLAFRPRPGLPPYEKAMSALEALRAKKIWQSGRVKDYHSELTDIIREYLYGQFSLHAHEMTTEEIITTLRSTNISRGPRESLKQVLELADLVKFAKVQPLPLENDQSWVAGRDFVEGTKPAPAEEDRRTEEDIPAPGNRADENK
jgi:hypothetical protein